MTYSLGDEVTRILFTPDDKLKKKMDRISRERGRTNLAIALELCDEYLDLCAQKITVKGDLCRAMFLVHRGAIHQDWGDPDEAHSEHLAASQLFMISNDEYAKWNQAVAIYGLALAAQSQRDWGKAQKLFKDAHSRFKCYADDLPIDLDAVAQVQKRLLDLNRMRKSESRTVRSSNEIPVIGRTSGGMPITAIPVVYDSALPDRIEIDYRSCRIKRYLDSSKSGPRDFWTSDRYFAVFVEGDSMKEADIDDGDYAIFRQQPASDPGDIVVVRIDKIDDSYSTVKQLVRGNGKVVLRAANIAFTPQKQVFTERDPIIEVLGKVVAVASTI